MSKEQPSRIEREKESTLEDVGEYFENEKDHYLNRARLIDRVLHLRAAERLRRITGHEKIQQDMRGEEKSRERMPGLLENFGKEKYEDCLAYIEEILGDGGAEQGGTNTLDLINHKEYGTHSPVDRNKDMESQEYQREKNYLRKLTDVLTGEIYKERKTELDEPLSLQEIENKVLVCITAKTGKNLLQVEEGLGGGNFREIFESLDGKIHNAQKKLEKTSEKADEEKLFSLRRYRRYFLNLQKEREG